MKTDIVYFYTENVKKYRDEFNHFVETHWQVIKVNVFNNSIDEAERKTRTIADKLGTKLAGGYFMENCKPYNLGKNYDMVNCPDNTKIQLYNDHDKFIMNLIEYESNLEYEIF